MQGRPLLFLLLSAFVVNALAVSFAANNTPPDMPIVPVPRASSFSEIELHGSVPSPRSGAVVGTTEEGFILLGGLVSSGSYEAWSYNANASTWQLLKTTFSTFGACSVQDDTNLYIYGSGGSNPGSHLYLYDLSSDTLTPLEVEGGPLADGIACGFRNGTIYLFGGHCTDAIFSYNTKGTEKKWTAVTVKSNEKPVPTKGASGLMFGDEFVMWGGSCSEDSNSVWRFDLLTGNWKADNSQSDKPVARSFHSAVVDKLAKTDSFIIFGGEDRGQNLNNDTWIYNLPNMTWVQLTPGPDSKTGYPHPRDSAVFVYHYGRAFIFSGNVDLLKNESIADLWQLVITEDCYERKTCDECVNTDGCGWCAANSEGYQCLPGYEDVVYIAGDCYLHNFSNDLTTCPADAFPGWIVALIIVATILVVGIVWYLVIRCQKKSGGYEQIN